MRLTKITVADYRNLIEMNKTVVEVIKGGNTDLAIQTVEHFIDICEGQIEKIEDVEEDCY